MPVRWKTVRCAACPAISGTNCTALAPVPTTATRLPASGKLQSHAAEWKLWPAKLSKPGIRGYAGWCSWPVASTTASASKVSCSVSTVQRQFASENRQAMTRASGVTSRSTPCSRATPRRYARMSACVGHSRSQSRRCANENEYRWLGTSQAAPG